MILDAPPQLILPDHYQANRPAIIRPGRSGVPSVQEILAQDGQKLGAIPAGMFKPSGPICTYIGRTVTATELTNYSHAAVNIGTPAADRLVVLVVANSVSIQADRSITGGTVGGVTCAVVANAHNPAINSNNCAILSALVPTGTTATVTVTNSGAVANNGFDVFTITGLASTTAYDTMTAQSLSSVATLSGNIDVAGGGVIIAGGSLFINSTFTWSGITEVADGNIDTTDDTSFSSAMSQGMSAEVNRAISRTTAGANNRVTLAAASWR
jgi:hypothetical protein